MGTDRRGADLQCVRPIGSRQRESDFACRRGEAGFTLVETLVASVLLIVGLLGVFAMLEVADAGNASARAREGATNTAREVLEQARAVPYAQIQPATLPATLQAQPGLASTSTGSWTVVRRGFTYTIAVSDCSLDDPRDGSGSHTGLPLCADSTATGTADAQPEDFKRVVATVTWREHAGSHSVTEIETLSSAGGSVGVTVTGLTLDSPSVANPSAPVITTNATTAVVTATAPGAANVVFSVDGVNQPASAVSADSNHSQWHYSWPIAGFKDGNYDVAARAVDALGVTGQPSSLTVGLARFAPAGPTGLMGGLNSVYVSGVAKQVAEIQWQANSERNVLGYRVYRGSTLVCPTSAQTLSLATSCVDLSPVAGTYAVAALYRDSSGVVKEGPQSTINVVGSSTRSYYFKASSSNNAGNCGAANSVQDMVEGYAGASSETTYQTNDINLCSTTLSSSDTLASGPATVVAWFDNGSNKPCDVTAALRRNGTTTLGTATLTIPASSSVKSYTWSIPTGVTSLVAGDRLNLDLAWPAATSVCKSTTLHYGGTTNRSRVDVPFGALAAPTAPTGLSATSNADGTTTLHWTASTGTTPAFYRIYRNGYDYTQRYDTAGAGTDTSYIDTNTGGATNTYYVTAVNGNLAESALVGPVHP
ncbi:MAG: hypothetical protein QOH11_2165 [Solirubrobacteraceae bacterium]|nr:hypothetical protein [Solirubrobacteraceae bacterium]